MNKLDDLLNIDTSNNALKFLYKRILCEDYRGLQISQHNRYTQEEVKIMLQEFYNVANTDIMQIRTTDLSKRPNESSGEEKYSRYINAVHDRLNRVTQDSMRKNYFVDFHRMGFIERLKYNGDPVSKFGRDSTKYVRLTNLGLSFINNDNIFQQNIIYNDGLNNLFKGFLRDFMLIICEHKKYISEYDYMFFISFLGFKIDDEIIDVYKIINLLKEFDKLSKFQKEYAINIIKNYCNPINFNGNKKDKRDFGNWKNETQQTFMLLGQTLYFEYKSERNEKKIFPRIGDMKKYLFENIESYKRSALVKQEYFKRHNVNKTIGFELHHVIALNFANNRNEYVLFDDWKNLVYIDGRTHSCLSQTGNIQNILEAIDSKNMVLKDNDNTSLPLIYNENIIYNPQLQKTMIDYNHQLRHVK